MSSTSITSSDKSKSKRCKAVAAPPSMEHRLELRLKLEISELLAEVNDFLWQCNGRPVYVALKLTWCPWTAIKEDLDLTKALLERAPNLEHMIKCRQLMTAHGCPESRKQLTKLERDIENVKKCKEQLAELVAKVQAQLSTRGHISPPLKSVSQIVKVKYASAGITSEKPKSVTVHFRENPDAKGVPPNNNNGPEVKSNGDKAAAGGLELPKPK